MIYVSNIHKKHDILRSLPIKRFNPFGLEKHNFISLRESFLAKFDKISVDILNIM